MTALSDLTAPLNVLYLRGLRRASLRVLLLASMPFWAQAYGAHVPEWLTWLAGLTGGTSLALAACYGALEYRWRGRVRQEDRGRTASAVIHYS
jgi:hypothetical protein